MKKFLALLLTTCLLLSGCSIGRGGEYIPTGDALVGSDLTDTRPPEEKPEQVLDLVYYPQLSLNPLKSDNYVNKMVLSLVHMGLFGVDKNYEAVPLLSGSYAVSEDLMTYYFYLAPGATFSDGTAVTMNDVYASYQVAQETEMYRNRFYHFSDISVNEAGALVVQLDTAFENLPILMDIPIIKASEVDLDRPLGAGHLAGKSRGRECRRTDDGLSRLRSRAGAQLPGVFPLFRRRLRQAAGRSVRSRAGCPPQASRL